METLGTQVWRAFDGSSTFLRGKRRLLLAYVLRDHPNLYLCRTCVRLCRKPLDDRPTYFNPPIAVTGHNFRCISEDGIMRLCIPYYTLTYSHVSEVMERHRLGPGTGKPLSTLSYDGDWDMIAKTKFSVGPRIVNNELFLRIDFTFYMRSDNPREYFDNFEIDSARFCPHFKERKGFGSPFHKLYCRLTHEAGVECEICDGVLQCLYCPTELEFKVGPREESGTRVQITAWKNLGQCNTCFSMKWLSHCERLEEHRKDEQTFSKHIGFGIKEAFESQVTSSVLLVDE